MKTVHDVKQAVAYDTMIKVVQQYKKEAAQAAKVVKPRKRRNKWSEVFLVCR